MHLWYFCGFGLIAGGSDVFILVDLAKRVDCFYIFFLHSAKVVYLLCCTTLKSYIFPLEFRIVQPAKPWLMSMTGPKLVFIEDSIIM